MANVHRLMKQGKLGELRDELRKLENRATGIIESMSIATFVQSSPFDLDAQKVLDYADELKKTIDAGNKCQAAIDDLEDELGV